MSLERANARDIVPLWTKERYEKRKREILTGVDKSKEIVRGEIIFCRRCFCEKIADFPERNFIVKCSCECEIKAWERQRETMSPQQRMKQTNIKKGDFNPFD